LGVVMARLLSSNEAECLIAQHRKPSGLEVNNAKNIILIDGRSTNKPSASVV
jgi:hypothetical protein